VTGSRLAGIRALLFDLDGVLTPTAEVHRRAWARVVGPAFLRHGAAPYTERDYFALIDGRPRYDGMRAALESRGIELPYGAPDDDPALETVCGLANRKNVEFTAELQEHGVAPYPASVAFLGAAEAAGLAAAVVSSSRNAPAVLAAAGLAARFGVVVDGVVAARLGLAGKPAPDTYLDAARELGRAPAECAVVEDAESGVAAGRGGGFGLVIGVDRGVGHAALLAHGAGLVVDELDELIPELPRPELPHPEEARP